MFIISLFYEIQPNELTLIRNKRELFFRIHLHKYIEILHVYKGVQLVDIDGISYEINEGDTVVIFPDTIHNYYKKGGIETDEILIIFDYKVINTAGVFPNINNLHLKTPVIRKSVLHQDAKIALNQIAESELLSLRLGWLYIIMSHILNASELIPNKNSPIENITQKIILYIEQNFKNNITLDTLAIELGVSKYYISGIFTNKIKMNFRSYLGLMRAEFAKKLIRSTNKNITEICSEAGFESQRTFNRIFKEIYGITPRELRVANKGNKT